jgi:hypothetical protein
VGTGKTITALAYALKEEPGRKIVVITTAKKRNSWDWQNEASKMIIHPDNIEVDSWNNIGKYVDYKDCFFIFDEQRLVGAGAWVKSFYKIAKKNRWILLSATPGDTWSDYAPMFIANGWYKNITEFRKEHAVYSRFTTYPKIERWVNEGKLQKYRKTLLVHMPMVRHTTRHLHHIECSYNKDLLDKVWKRRWNVFTDEPVQNAAELYGVMRKVVATDPSRAVQIQRLIRKHPRLIVFYNFDYELEMLRDLCTKLEVSENQEEPWESTISMISAMTRTDLSPEDLRIQWSDPLRTDSPTASPVVPSSTTRATKSSGVEQLHEPTPRASGKDSSRRPVSRMGSATARSTRVRLTPKQTQKSRHDEKQSERTASSSSSSTRMKPPTRGSRSPRTTSQSSLTPPPNEKWLKKSSPSQRVSPEKNANNSSDTPSPMHNGNGSFSWAEYNGHKHQPLPTTEAWIYLVQYQAGSESWNCVETNAVAYWSLTYSYKQFHQSQGRIDRLNTLFKDLHYYVLMTDSVAERPVMQALEQKKDFQPR